MAENKGKALRCPSCGTLVLPAEVQFPFCSDRCRLIDLGKWASGAYRISSPMHDPELGPDASDNMDDLRSAQRGESDRDPDWDTHG